MNAKFVQINSIKKLIYSGIKHKYTEKIYLMSANFVKKDILNSDYWNYINKKNTYFVIDWVYFGFIHICIFI